MGGANRRIARTGLSILAAVKREHDMGLWRVRNISDRGIMLATRLEVTPGEPLLINLSDSICVGGRAVWWDGERCGVAFDQPIDCAATLAALVAEQKQPHYRPPRLAVRTPSRRRSRAR